ncbi:hypothetical protein BGZ49_006988 [Haplosporangium sp. Z 27]|nr:hypothetical protein BGZ49_006988 [Haplosporangium sp. Z 27]
MASEFNLVESDSLTPPNSQQPNSIKTAELILDIESTREQLAEAEGQLRTIQKLKLAGDIENHSIDERISCLDDFTNQINMLQQNRVQLINKLNQPRVGPYILMDHQYHKDFVGLFQRIQQEIPKLQQNLDALSWKDQFLGSTTTLEQLKTNLDELLELSQQQTEIVDATQRLQNNLDGVLQRSK